MSMGAYDEDEHERREKKASSVDVKSDDERTEYRGSITYDAGGSAEELLDQFRRLREES